MAGATVLSGWAAFSEVPGAGGISPLSSSSPSGQGKASWAGAGSGFLGRRAAAAAAGSGTSPPKARRPLGVSGMCPSWVSPDTALVMISSMEGLSGAASAGEGGASLAAGSCRSKL